MALRLAAFVGLAALARGMPAGTSANEAPTSTGFKTLVTRTVPDILPTSSSTKILVTRSEYDAAPTSTNVKSLVTRSPPNAVPTGSSMKSLVTRASLDASGSSSTKILVTRSHLDAAPTSSSTKSLVTRSAPGGADMKTLVTRSVPGNGTATSTVNPTDGEPPLEKSQSFFSSIVNTVRDKVRLHRRQGQGQHLVDYAAMHVEDTYVTLVNATPYRWKRRYMHQYQLVPWEGWPEYIEPGESVHVYLSPMRGSFYHSDDSAAEVEYVIERTREDMSFMVKFNNHAKGSVKVQFQDALASLNNPRNSTHELGYTNRLGGSGFVIAGMEGEFITNDAPIGWMQAMLPELGKIPFRQIILPMSHHAGLWKIHEQFNFGRAANTQTQSVGLEHQLGDGGIRVLDFRPVWRKSEFREGHGTKILHDYHGAIGASLNEMIEIVNNFNKQYPGEMIIFDVHNTDCWNGNREFREFDSKDRSRLYEQLMGLEHRLNVTDENEDITMWPLERFIGNKKSVVLIRFDESWRWKDDGKTFPGGQHGFVTNKNIPSTHHWSEMISVDAMVKNQVENFIWYRPWHDAQIHIADWVLTQVGINSINPPSSASILELSKPALRTLYQGLWKGATSEQYPSWVSVDNVHGNQHKSILLAMNHCLVAKRCGTLGGKVRDPRLGQ